MNPPPSPAGPRWQVRLLGGVEAISAAQHLGRFPSRAVAALLARLALAPGRDHAREELVELLWPGVALDVGRNRLRQALSTLKSLLEPPGSGAVLQADRLVVRVAPGALGCDALAFEQAVRAGRGDEARSLYRGELMPGFYDEWIDAERQRLLALHERLAAAAPPERAAPPPVAAPRPAAAAAPLPGYLTRLFGAGPAAARLRALLPDARLVTLLGPGGSGKTRLAVAVAQSLLVDPAFDRVLFVPLVACEDEATLREALARALQLHGGDAGSAALVAALAGARTLLVLDNFEQLVGQAEALVAELLARLPALHVLVTSRRALGLDGEQVLAADPLPLPEANAPLAEAADNPAVALFVDRARAARADFHLHERNRGAVVALVQTLHGLPLAIELAASRVRSVPPSEMVALLAAGEGSAHLALLARSGPRAGADPRHASMAQVIAWSWRLLDADAQRALAAVALFPADAPAAALAALLGRPLPAVSACLDDLVGHSLLRVVEAPGEMRFALQEPLREFVHDATDGSTRDGLRAGLRAWLLAWARALPTVPRLADVAAELPAVHRVLAEAAAAPDEAFALLVALRKYWESDSLPERVLVALEAALPPQPDADVLDVLAHLRTGAGDGPRARAHAAAGLAAAGAEPGRRARALLRRVWCEVAFGHVDDRQTPVFGALLDDIRQALALARSIADRDTQARALQYEAVLWCNVHLSSPDADLERAEALFAQAEALWLELGDVRRARDRQRNRAQCRAWQGRRDEALAVYQRLEAESLAEGDWVGQMDNQVSQCALLCELRRWPEALDACRRTLRIAHGRWHLHALAYALWNIARPLARLHQPVVALRLMAFAERFWTERMGPLREDDLRYLRIVRRLARVQLGAAGPDAPWRAGRALSLGDAVAEALGE